MPVIRGLEGDRYRIVFDNGGTLQEIIDQVKRAFPGTDLEKVCIVGGTPKATDITASIHKSDKI